MVFKQMVVTAVAVALVALAGCTGPASGPAALTVTNVVEVPTVTVVTETEVVTETVEPSDTAKARRNERLREAFVADLREQGFALSEPDRAMLTSFDVCSHLDGTQFFSDDPPKTRSEVIDMYVAQGDRRAFARALVDTAIRHFCPQHQ